jgi:hypothetical protein
MNVKITNRKNKKIDIDLSCDRCGEPIIDTDALGMHCKNRCYDKDNKKALMLLKQIFPLKELGKSPGFCAVKI